MVALRADHDVDRRLAAQDLGALRLGDAAGHHQRRPAAGLPTLVLELAQLAEFGEDLLRRPFANVAGVEDDEVGLFGRSRLGVSLRRGQIGHPLRVVDIHLAAEGLDEGPPFCALCVGGPQRPSSSVFNSGN